MSKKTTVDCLVDGGKATAGPPLGSSLGPLKVNVGAIVTEINKKTADFKGMKVPVKVIIDNDTKAFEIEIGTPPASQLIKTELKLDKGSSEPDKVKVDVLAIEQVIKIAKMKMGSLLVRNLKNAVKTIAGSCVPLGILIEGKSVAEVIKEIDSGKYDSEINSEKTEVPAEKAKMLDEIRKELKKKVAVYNKELEAKKAAEAEKAAKKAANVQKAVEAPAVKK